MGGAEIYNALYNFCKTAYITKVSDDGKADVFIKISTANRTETFKGKRPHKKKTAMNLFSAPMKILSPKKYKKGLTFLKGTIIKIVIIITF